MDLHAVRARLGSLARRGRAVRWWAAVAVALLVVAVVRAALGREVAGWIAERRRLVQRVVASGRVMAPARLALASLTLARVAAVLVDEGDDVKAGQVLVRLDDAEARAGLAQAEGRVAEAQARVEQVRSVGSKVSGEQLRQAELRVAQAARDLERARQLFDAGSSSQAQLDDARKALELARSQQEGAAAQAMSAAGGGADFRAAAAALRQAQGALALARTRLADSEIRAPAAGRVLSRTVEPGDVVAAGKTLLVVARAGDTRLTVQPDEKNLALLRVGQPAVAIADAFPDLPFPVAVSFVAPAVDAARGTVEVRLAVPEPPQFLRPDMTVSVNVDVGGRDDALVLPAEAVRDAGGTPWVLAVAQGRAERREVKLGLRGGGMIEILEGLAPGARVVAPSAGLVEPGARVRVHPPDAGPERGRAL